MLALLALGAVFAQIDATGRYSVDAEVNGRAARMVVDTGASGVSFSETAAAHLRLPHDGEPVIYTIADGSVMICRDVLATIRLGQMRKRRIHVSVCPGNGESLLGSAYLHSVGIVAVGGRLMLSDP